MPITYHDAGRTIQKRLTSSVEAGQLVEASLNTEVAIGVTPTSNVELGASISKEVDHPVYDRTPSSDIDVGQKVFASVDKGVAIGVTPTADVGLEASISKEVDHPVYERAASSTVDVGQSVSATTDTAVQVSASPTSAVGVSSTQSSTVDLNISPSEPFQNDLPDYDAVWTDGSTDYSDLSDVLEGSVEARVDLSGTATGIIAESGASGDDGAALVVHENGGTRTLMAMVGDGEDLVDGDHAVVEYDISGLSGYHKVGWSADASEQTLVLYVDGTVVGKDTYAKEDATQGRLAGTNTGTVGTNSGGVRELGLGWSTSGDYTYDGIIAWCTVYTGVSTGDVVAPVYDRTGSTIISVGQSVSASTDTASQVGASPTSPVDVSSSVTTEVDEPVTVSPSNVFTNLGSYTANWNDASVGYHEMENISEGSAEVQAYYQNGYTGVLMESGGDGKGMALVITDNDDLLIMAGDGGNTLPSNGVAVASISMAGYSSGTYKFGWSCSDLTEQVALYINGTVVDTGTFTSIHNVIGGGDDGGIKTAHGDLRNLGQGWNSGIDWTYNGTIDWCVVYPGDITPDVQQTNSAPNADLVVTDDPSGDLVVEADAGGSSDPDGDFLTYDYDWGDGTSSTNSGSLDTHTYASEGTYTVTVTVDDGNTTDDASQDVTVSAPDPPSGGGEVVHDFELGNEGWVSVQSGVGRTTEYARNGSYSYGGAVSIAQSGELAYVEPPELSGGNKIESLTFHFLEESSSTGGFIRLFDDSGISVLGAGTDNPEWDVYDVGGNFVQIYNGNGRYKDWIKVEITFDWSAGTADVTFTNETTGTSQTENSVSIGGNNVEKIQLSNYNSEDFESSGFNMWIDDLTFVPSTSTSGPSFNDGVEESFTKEGANTASHDASWDGSAAPYEFRIYKDSSKQTLIYSNQLIYSTSDNQDNYATATSISDLTFGSSVYFEVTDNNGNSSTTSVSTSVSV